MMNSDDYEVKAVRPFRQFSVGRVFKRSDLGAVLCDEWLRVGRVVRVERPKPDEKPQYKDKR